jgi:hypothetical protein
MDTARESRTDGRDRAASGHRDRLPEKGSGRTFAEEIIRMEAAAFVVGDGHLLAAHRRGDRRDPDLTIAHARRGIVLSAVRRSI